MEPKKSRNHRRSKKRGVQTLFIPDLPSSSAPVILASDPDLDEIMSRFEPPPPAAPVDLQNAEPDEEPTPEPEISRQQIRKYGRPTVAELKAAARRPELIEPHDVDAPDPFSLVELRNTRNVVPVPQHWSQKRKYLNYKRGSEVSRYRLPSYLEQTGIGKMRQAIRELDEKKSIQQRQRDRAKPKLGMLDLPPELLYNAFYRDQTKPPLTRFGDMYFENKELMPSARNIRPGRISEKLREALGMMENSPPPWLFKMQKLGPPPSYPNLKIPGLNAPLPPGCEWGSHLGGWGQVPLNENGTPVWGGNPFAKVVEADDEERKLWCVMERGDGVQDGVNIF